MADPDNNSDNNGKVSDSVYSNSYNSQSTRSHSSKSLLRSGSNSSGSSGYGGNPSTGSSGDAISYTKRHKENVFKADKSTVEAETITGDDTPEAKTDNMKHDVTKASVVADTKTPFVNDAATTNIEDEAPGQSTSQKKQEDFSCVVSIQDGVIMYSTATLRTILGYPQEMWVGRSFIDFVHPRDQRIFASQISIIEGSPISIDPQCHTHMTVHCRLRRYNGLSFTGFDIKNKSASYLPFKLVLSFNAENQSEKPDEKKNNKENLKAEQSKYHGVYIVIQATSIVTAFKVPLDILYKGGIFVMRHSALGVIEYVDPASMPYLGYMPHDLIGRCAIKMYHPEDLCYMRRVYETLVKFGQAPKTSFRMLTQNGDYVRVETEFTCFVNPWPKKMEYINGQYEVIQGPCDIEVFGPAESERSLLTIKKVRINAEIMKDHILRTMNEEKESVLMGEITSQCDNCDSNSGSTDTSPSYNQMNYKDNMQRFFDSKPTQRCTSGPGDTSPKEPSDQPNSDCISSSASCVNGPVAMESYDEDHAAAADGNAERNAVRLTEVSLQKHNQEMEKVLAKEHREVRYRPEKKNLSRQRLEHLARCNAFQEQNKPAGVFVHPQPRVSKLEVCKNVNAAKRDLSHSTKGDEVAKLDTSKGKREVSTQGVKRRREHPHHETPQDKKREIRGVKRDMTAAAIPENSAPHKQAKTPGQSCDVHTVNSHSPLTNISLSTPPPSSGDLWSGHNISNINLQTTTFESTISPNLTCHTMLPSYSPAFLPPVWTNQSSTYTTITNPAQASQLVSGLYPMYYLQETGPAPAPTVTLQNMVQLMLYPHVYGQPIVYAAPVTSSVASPTPASQPTKDNITQTFDDSSSNRSANNEQNSGSEQDLQYKTEGETSSSFYSSLLRVDTNGEDQGKSNSEKDTETRNNSKCLKWVRGQSANVYSDGSGSGPSVQKEALDLKYQSAKKMEPQWMQQVSATSDLFYRYTVPLVDQQTKLDNDIKFLQHSYQSEDVNNQLGQLYLDLHLQGVTSRLTLEEGLTSSGSSGDENSPVHDTKKKRPYSKLAMIYEEDSPFPPALNDATQVEDLEQILIVLDQEEASKDIRKLQLQDRSEIFTDEGTGRVKESENSNHVDFPKTDSEQNFPQQVTELKSSIEIKGDIDIITEGSSKACINGEAPSPGSEDTSAAPDTVSTSEENSDSNSELTVDVKELSKVVASNTASIIDIYSNKHALKTQLIFQAPLLKNDLISIQQDTIQSSMSQENAVIYSNKHVLKTQLIFQAPLLKNDLISIQQDTIESSISQENAVLVKSESLVQVVQS